MKDIDRMILDASPDELARIQLLDIETQLDGRSFYDTCVESKTHLVHRTATDPGRIHS